MQILKSIPAEVDVESLMIQLRAGAREGGGAMFGSSSHAQHSAKRDAVSTHLSEVERYAEVGTVVPAFERFGKFKRKAARFTSRVVLYLGRVISVPQQRVNFAALQALRGIIGCLKDEETARLELQARVQLLERTVAVLRSQLENAPAGRDEHPAPWQGAHRPAVSHHR
jgi:hypothetical protein